MRRQENGRVTIFVVLLVLVLITVVACGGAYLWYKSAIKPIQSNSEQVEIEIAQGSGISKIAEQLENDGVIKSANAFKIYCMLYSRYRSRTGNGLCGNECGGGHKPYAYNFFGNARL